MRHVRPCPAARARLAVLLRRNKTLGQGVAFLPHRFMPPMPTLLDPITLGDLHLPNRILLAPLTRNRSSGAGRVPNALMRDYFVQRASDRATITEATSVSPTVSPS